MAAHSRFVRCAPHQWHVQEMGEGPVVLLIHGAGGATQSWRHLMPILAQRYRVIAMDLPGQGFTKAGAQQRYGLAAMAQDIVALCADQGWEPHAIVGHSAGCAIALQMAQNMTPAPRIVGINAALQNFSGVAGVVFPLAAKALAMTPWVARIFTATSRPSSIKRLMDGTGSRLDDEGLGWYQKLIGDRGHVDATLMMMAHWDLAPLAAGFEAHPSRILLLAAENDKTVAMSVSRNASQRLKMAEFVEVPKYGHLVHEEAAAEVAQIVLPFLADEG